MSQKDQYNAGVTRSNIRFCDMRCEHASFPKQEHIDGSQSCRTFMALYCSKLDQLVSKNAPCAAEFGQRRPKSNI